MFVEMDAQKMLTGIKCSKKNTSVTNKKRKDFNEK